MTDLLDTPTRPAAGPTGGGGGPVPHPVLGFVDGLRAALDAVAGAPAWSMTPGEQAQALVGLRAQRARLVELELRVLVSADRNGVGTDAGATSTAAWLADATTTTRVSCFGDLRLARALDEGFDATRRALAAGVIDVDRATVVVHAVQALTSEYDDLPPGTHATAQARMLELAAVFDAPRLRQLGKRLFEVVCPEAADRVEGQRLAREEERARRLAYLSMRETGDGTTQGRFRLPTLHGHLLKKALETLTSPRRLGQGRADPVTGRKLAASTLLGHGLMDLLENHLNLASLPGAGGSPFTLVITLDLEALKTGLGVAAVETGHRISAGEARRLACGAGVIPMVLGGDSVPLDLGRARRLFTRSQQIAMDHLHGGCAATGCDRPASWVEYHHLSPWAAGGNTDLGNGLPLCPPHHQMADHPNTWNMKRMPTGGVRFTRRQ